MSSILRALKKLETDTRPPAAEEVHWPTPVDTRKTIGNRAKETFFLHRLIYGLFAVFILFGGIWLLWFRQPASETTPPVHPRPPIAVPTPSPAPASPPVPERPVNAGNVTDREPVTPAPPAVATRPRTPASVAATPPRPATRPATPRPAPSPRNTEATGQATIPRPVPVAPTPRPATPPSSPKPETTGQATAPRPAPPAVPTPRPAPSPKIVDQPAKPVPPVASVRPRTAPAKPAPAPAPSEPPAATRTADPYADVPVGTVETLGLQVQALVWSEDEASRLAVINGNIVKTGGTVDGNVLQFIGEDFVIIQKGPRNWKLKFQLK